MLSENVHSYLKPELKRLDELMREIVAGDFPLINHGLERLINAGGKRLRGIIVLLAARGNGANAAPVEQALETAAAVELIHLATLIHDDVIDRAAERRGEPTLHNRLDNQTAVLIGDHLYARVIHRLTTALERLDIIAALARAVDTLCQGEIRQLHVSKLETPLDENGYLRIIQEKTADFFSACGRMGALLTGDAELTRRLSEYGLALGTAFQITDDLLDYRGRSELTGKDSGNDLAEGRITLPLIHAFKRGAVSTEELTTTPADDIARRVIECGALESAAAVGEEYINRALTALNDYPNQEVGELLRSLVLSISSRNS
ncbi:polyprenyl synthetase family protein [bacterium]|nr:polyprenyl synthetase family protein [bacterium]